MERYTLLEMLGEGTFATCWKGKHRETGQVSAFTRRGGREGGRVGRQEEGGNDKPQFQALD